jgi:CRISPR/Cas system-associated exonuclease Cas4 (RecB family)
MSRDMIPFDLDAIYLDYIDKENDKNFKDRYKNNEGWYRASSAGFCSRKMYYESVLKLEPQVQPKNDSKMKMRLGTIFHDELQGALKSFSPHYIYNFINTEYVSTEYVSTEYEKEKDKYIIEKEKVDVHIEGNIQLPDLNVRGHYDIVFESGQVFLYDIKTIGAYPWSLKFGRNRKPQSRQHPLQLGTYALGVEEQFGRIDGMYLYYYNKDSSKTKTVEVPMIEKSKAYMYWEAINEEHAKGLPKLELGQSPEQKWACGYCGFVDICKPEKYLQEQKDKGVWF